MIVPVSITTPDGVERSLRFTLGTRRRISRDLGKPFAEVMQSLSDEDLPTLLYNCLFDEDGNPPAGLTVAKLEESYDPGDSKELLADLFVAMSQGSIKKNEAVGMIEEHMRQQMKKLAGSTSGASPDNISEFPAVPRRSSDSPANSGTSQRKSSKRSVMLTKNSSEQNSPALL